MKKRPRTERREAEREAVKLAKARLQLAGLEAGGSPGNPIEVASSAVVEPHAASTSCAVCGGPVRVEEHTAVTQPRQLRIARVRCTQCGVERELYYRLGTVMPN
jgi:hypothetical protein